ncbi:ribonuclease H1/H2 small subunit [Colletotrichum graminicola]|uniref:Ribonuclease H1/H2 small subunit n=1 Tax=Colletotrichum graminicola (strain M1.001 / M2 / FGSC 10212) TaxID=645133 RepID=E3QIL7_COLGM|nr:ribonuclease H1/H2 small subunit [Colletotrichum graminicola M1.001]EFQ30627.1 ribonuclease H1/H2 small subunit [Colletotrichum graminicola M1.001]WDK21352.1 ribonuclease H1/H2 small subunit [Colletotrichum graminicola]
MSKAILSIRSNESDEKSKAVANLLPCRIHHNGPIGDANTFWNPVRSEDGNTLAYFRGRKLHGTTVKLPEQYRGVVMEKSDKVEAQQLEVEGEGEGAEGDLVELGTMHVKAVFDEIVIWGHESSAEAASDPYMRSIEEWLAVAESVHSYPSPEIKNGA